ncbi:DUF2793 domain-containing protein [Devosia sp.]|uniref:DUF2793 domain-containing protein n=1 Tax=Devosia sp. TaxID=1871048 RepID=UPI003267E5AD
MDNTSRLSLPFIMPQQAQKHVTHNEALQTLDALVQPVVKSRTIATPPGSPMLGDAYILPASPTGAWAGHATEIAVWQNAAWSFLDPANGWQAYIEDAQAIVVFQSTAWVALAGNGAAGVPMVGINTGADSTNRLAVAAAATLLSHDGNGHQLKLNKAASTDTASLLYQSNHTGYAEMGLAGDNHWRLKVSPNGSSWVDALKIDNATGGLTVVAAIKPATDNSITLGASGARWSAVWAATGTIQTSDARQKTDIAPSDLGLDFISALEPVRYRWSEGKRTHYGLLAQQVKVALDQVGVDDFAGYILTDPADPQSEQGLRYDAFIAPLIKSIQQLNARLATLEKIAQA